jgi:ATP-dependent protease HslVU (ClpYQ) peptidase subunit
MTTLVAIQGDGWTVLGCDSRISDDDGRFAVSKTPKIVENNGILIAGCGSSRASNVLHHGYVQPKPTPREDLDKFISQKFIPAMRKSFVDAGIDMKEDGDVAQIDGGFLISVKGQVFSVSEDYSWDTDVRNLYVMGSGGDIALGALAALGVSSDIRAQIQSHGLGGVQARHYDRHNYMGEKLSTLEKWNLHLDKMITGQVGIVILMF